MVTAIVHIKADVDRIPEVAQTVAELDGVSEVYSITGEYDLLAMIRVGRYEQIAEIVPGRINKVPGVQQTETHIAFRTYSRHDLDAAFSIGLNEAD
ncbi:Lrp/AsnC family transcriptional regulator [Microtetraspora fusca]|uniref:Lrp/AsnC family transcriptional regulator n=1 Tax=Microtetraspora fusca TaxID=1997 RepID=A0ABW6UYS8_MICFU|nr:Lrp/AsnC ligand binding domain-containing protein [Microtetraspora fusca]